MKFASDGWVKLSERAEKAEQDAAEARASLERERKARHAAERVNADEVLRKRTNLEARIEAAEMERDEAVARAEAAEAELKQERAHHSFAQQRGIGWKARAEAAEDLRTSWEEKRRG